MNKLTKTVHYSLMYGAGLPRMFRKYGRRRIKVAIKDLKLQTKLLQFKGGRNSPSLNIEDAALGRRVISQPRKYKRT